MFIRLCTLHSDPDTRLPQGVFIAAQSLEEAGRLSSDELADLRELTGWFAQALPTPPNSDDLDPKAIYWFKDGVGELRQKVWELAQLLRSHGVHVELIKTQKPGYVIYEDEFQVAALPFRDTL